MRLSGRKTVTLRKWIALSTAQRSARTARIHRLQGTMTARRNFSILRFAAFSVVTTISLAWLPPAGGADRAISIPVQITHAQNFDPFPSPDGKKLIFISMISGKEQLFTMDADGSHIAQVTRDDADHEDPAWSPDGNKIAFVLITRTIPASRSWELTAATWKCSRHRTRIPSIRTGRRIANA